MKYQCLSCDQQWGAVPPKCICGAVTFKKLEINTQTPKPKYRFPRFARLILGQYNAWLVGSAANPNNEDPRDYDIVVAWEDWKHVSMLVPKDAKITLFGGFKVESDGKTVDIWPDTLTSAIQCAKTKYISNPFKGILMEIKRTGKEQT